MQGEFAGGAGDPSGGAEVTAAEGVGGDEGLAQADAADPAGEVVGDDVEDEPGGVGAEPARRQVVEPDTVFEVADGVFDDGVAAVVGFELEGWSPSRSVMKAW